MQLYTHTLPSGAKLTGYLRDETNEMPAFNIRPAMLILPGGGYAFCSAREADPIAMQFLQAGYQTFVLEYTCAHTPEQAPLRWQPLIDAAGAILHLRRNAAKLRLDPFKIAVCGFSAGGHLAASTAILWDAAPVQKALGITAEEARPDAVVLATRSLRRASRPTAGPSPTWPGTIPPCRRSSAWKTRCAAICRHSSSGTPWPTRLCRWRTRCCWPAP